MPFNIEDLHDTIAAVAPIDGVCILGPGAVEQAGWHVVTVGGFRVRIDYQQSASEVQITAGDAAAVAFALQQLDGTGYARYQATRLLQRDGGHLAKAVRGAGAATVAAENTTRDFVNSVVAAVINNATLPAIKAVLLALGTLPHITAAQAVSAAASAVSGGSVD